MHGAENVRNMRFLVKGIELIMLQYRINIMDLAILVTFSSLHDQLPPDPRSLIGSHNNVNAPDPKHASSSRRCIAPCIATARLDSCSSSQSNLNYIFRAHGMARPGSLSLTPSPQRVSFSETRCHASSVPLSAPASTLTAAAGTLRCLRVVGLAGVDGRFRVPFSWLRTLLFFLFLTQATHYLNPPPHSPSVTANPSSSSLSSILSPTPPLPRLASSKMA